MTTVIVLFFLLGYLALAFIGFITGAGVFLLIENVLFPNPV